MDVPVVVGIGGTSGSASGQMQGAAGWAGAWPAPSVAPTARHPMLPARRRPAARALLSRMDREAALKSRRSCPIMRGDLNSDHSAKCARCSPWLSPVSLPTYSMSCGGWVGGWMGVEQPGAEQLEAGVERQVRRLNG